MIAGTRVMCHNQRERDSFPPGSWFELFELVERLWQARFSEGVTNSQSEQSESKKVEK